MHASLFIQDLAIVILVAGVVSLIFRKLKQPVVLGYILAGVIVGPHTPPVNLIHDQESIDTLAQLGVIFLMFSLGLHFSLRKISEVGLTAIIAATLEILIMLLIGYQVGQAFGWGTMDSLFLGGILSISSTTIIVKALSELGRTKEKFAELVYGILIVEDILGIALLALLSSIALTGKFQAMDLLHTFGRLGLFLAVVLVLGLALVPALIRSVAKLKSREMTLITVLGLCFGVSLLAIKLGYSQALGAFLTGALLAESSEHETIDQLIEPLRDLFSAIFFVSVGLLIDPALMLNYAVPIAVITAVVVIGKVLSCSFGTFVAGNDPKTSLHVGMSLAQIGEFSFIIAGLGLGLGVTSSFLYPIAVTVSVLTTFLTPYLIRASDPLTRAMDRFAPRGLLAWLELYPKKIQGLKHGKETSVFKQQVRRALLVLAINFAFITAIFIGADYIADHLALWLPASAEWHIQPPSISWFVAMLLSLPFLVASFRKTHALGLIVGEGSTGYDPASTKVKVLRTVIANTIVIAAMLALGLWIAYLSTTLYTPRSALIGMSILLILIVAIFWRLFIRLYSKFQASLEESLHGG